MIPLHELAKYYPENLLIFKRFILREYLQYRILDIIFNGPHAHRLSFLGGTCLRILHLNQRFSEDLDFDNFDISIHEFDEVSKNIASELSKSGYQVEIKLIAGAAYHCYIRFPGILFEQGLSGYTEEKILIQLDTEAQGFKFIPEQVIINKFDIFSRIASTPLDIIMAQKCYAILNRKRNKGRDFFDLVFLMGKGIIPNMKFIDQKLGFSEKSKLKKMLLERCKEIDMDDMARDVAPFLFHSNDTRKVSLFPDYLESYDW